MIAEGWRRQCRTRRGAALLSGGPSQDFGASNRQRRHEHQRRPSVSRQKGKHGDVELAQRPCSSVTVHGFRATFKSWAADKTDCAREVIEAALAHVIGDKAEQAYVAVTR
jgi:integrase